MNIHKPHNETQKSDTQKRNFYLTVTSFYIMAASLPAIVIVYCTERLKLSRAFTYSLISALAEVSEIFDRLEKEQTK